MSNKLLPYHTIQNSSNLATTLQMFMSRIDNPVLEENNSEIDSHNRKLNVLE